MMDIVPAGKGLARVPDLEELFGTYSIRGIRSWEDVVHLGRNNIGHLLSLARHDEKALTAEIAELKEHEKLFRGRDGSHFVELAKEFERPLVVHKGLLRDSWGGDPEPLDAEDQNRKHGSSTYNLCGWCRYASGSHRYSYCISGSCQLLREMPEQEGFRGKEVKFDMPCRLHFFDENDCTEVADQVARKVDQLLVRRENVRMGIRMLIRLRYASPIDKPWLPDWRPHDYMNVGDQMAIYAGNWSKSEKIIKEEWFDAVGVFGYRHHDGCMSYQALLPIHSNKSYLDGRGGGAGMSRPEALLRKEFDYLHAILKRRDFYRSHAELMSSNHHDGDSVFVRCWFGNISQHLDGFRVGKFYQDLKRGRFAKPAPVQLSDKTFRVRTIEDAARVLQMLDAKLFKTKEEIESWANMQLQYVHPDKHMDASEEVRQYAARQTKAVIEARDFLIAHLKR